MTYTNGARSRGTSLGMRRWHMKIPRCSGCNKVRLVTHWARLKKLCASCASEKEKTHIWSYEKEKWYQIGDINYIDVWATVDNRKD